MIRRSLFTLLLVIVATAAAQAQISVRGQILLPNGDVPSNPIRFYLSRDDGNLNEYRFTDSNGRFILERLSGAISHTITVESDGSTYDTTSYSFIPAYVASPRVVLNPLTRKVVTGPPTLSAAAAYKANPEARQLHETAMKEIENEQYETAEKNLRRASELDPRFFDALNDLGVLLMNQKRHAEAETVLRRAHEADAKSVHALLNLGITLNHLKKHAEADELFREALRLQPGLLAARLHRGVALVEMEKFKEAEPELLRAAKSEGPESAGAHLYLGKLYARTGEFEKAIAALETYLQKAPGGPNAAEARSLIERLKRELAARR